MRRINEYAIQKDGFQFFDDVRLKMIVEKEIIDDVIMYILSKKIDSISIFWPLSTYGKRHFDVQFLSLFKDFLLYLDIAEEYITTVRPIDDLHKLKRLSADGTFEPIYLSNYPDLEELAIGFTKKVEGKESLPKLRYLSTSIPKGKDKTLNTLGTYPLLADLRLNAGTATNDLSGLERYPKLTRLQLDWLFKLETFGSSSGRLATLEHLKIESCKKLNLLEIGQMPNLKWLHIENCGEIPSLDFIVENCPNLERLFFHGTKVADGDIQLLEKLKYFKAIHFKNEKHYNLKLAEAKLKWPEKV